MATTKTTDRKVKPREDVVIKWMGDKWHEADSSSTVHAVAAEKLIKDGKAYLATDKRPEDNSKSKKQNDNK